MEIFYTVNSGLYLLDTQTALLIDGVHRGEKVAFSSMPSIVVSVLNKKEKRYGEVKGLLFTHSHPDHFDEGLLTELTEIPPMYGPDFGNIYVQNVRPGVKRVCMDGAIILAIDTIHAGQAFSNVPHCSFLIEMDQKRIFVAGDADLGKNEAQRIRAFCSKGVDVAFMNPLQLLDPKGEWFLRELMPQQVFVYHLPFQKDDSLGCNLMAEQVEKKYS